jgi:thiol:disulfide interchange protein
MQKLAITTLLLIFVSTSLLLAQKSYGTLYAPEANAEEDISQLLTKAKTEGKHLLIQVGGNWCVWCYRLEEFINDNESLKTLRDENFLIYHLNYSKENKNTELLSRYRFPQRFGFPVLLVLDGDGALLHTQDSALLEDGEKSYDLKKLTNFFKGWSPMALDPATYKK